jgi:cation diffusion facilitator family transporter
MHVHRTEHLRHEHVFLGDDHARNERRTWWVVGLTLVMMVAEITAGTWYGSMALLADGWHMGTHAGALGLSAGAYWYARRHARDGRFTFGTGKVGDLAGFASALLLGAVALAIAVESVRRLWRPVPIAFDEALVVAVVGLGVNLLSAWLLGGGGAGEGAHAHTHDHGRDHDHADHGHGDHNLRAAYLHVLADALTSVLAIVALLVGRFAGWTWLDPVIGVVGAIVIGRWSVGLMRETGAVLLDASADPTLEERVRAAIEVGDEKVSDLHVWRVGPRRYAALVSLVATRPADPDHYKARLRGIPEIVHISVEAHRCPDHA